MNPVANAHSRPAYKDAHWIRRGLLGISLVLAAIVIAQWLAGYFLLWSFHLSPRHASPLTVMRYAVYYSGNLTVQHRLWLTSGIGLGLVVAAILPAALPKTRSLHGDARLATSREIARAGLFSDYGILLGRFGPRYLILPGQQSVILAAPPRSGKDVGVVIPNALHWPGSLVIIDIKRETWGITAGFRASQGQACHLLDLLAEDGRTARWNCLSYVSSHPARRINDIQRIADKIYTESPSADPFWATSARSLFVGIALYVLETQELPKTIGEIRRQGMASGDEGFGAHWRRIVEGRQSSGCPLSDECVRALCDVIDLAPVTASSIRKTFTSRLDLWASPLLDAATSGDDFDLRDLRRKPMSIYVAVNPDDLHRLQPVLSLFFEQCLGEQTRELPEHNPELKYQVLMILNEFTALGKIHIISKAMSYVPGYNVRMLLSIQAISQLRETYGSEAADTMLKSAAARIVFAPKDFPDAKEISDELGVLTVKARSQSRPSAAVINRANSARSGSVNFSEHARPLLLPQEVKEIGHNRALVLHENLRPILCSKIRYYADRRFRRRLLSPPERPPSRLQPSGKQGIQNQPSVPGNLTPGEGLARECTEAIEQEAFVDDLQRLDHLTLDDFGDRVKGLKFEHAGDRPTDAELDADVRRFLDAVR